jgi:hypothetical protein
MTKRWRAPISKKSYRGIVAVGPKPTGPPDEWGFYELRPHRFAPLNSVGAVEILTELVNLPDDAKSKQVEEFVNKFHNLTLGLTSSDMLGSERMAAEEVIRLRGLYRLFWEVPEGDQFKSNIFVLLIGPWREAYSHSKPIASAKTRYPLRDFRNSALQMNWKSGQFKIVARGPVDFLTHAVFQNRNRLRTCLGENCGKLFVAFGPHEKHCSATCKLEAGRKRKREWFRKNLAKATKGERN